MESSTAPTPQVESTQASYENVRTALKDIAEKKAINMSAEQVNMINEKADEIAKQKTSTLTEKMKSAQNLFDSQLNDKNQLIEHKMAENAELAKKMKEMDDEMTALKKFRQDHLDKQDKRSKDVFQRALKLHTQNRPSHIFAFSENAHNTKESTTQLLESMCEIIDSHHNQVHEPTVQAEELPHAKKQRTSGLIDFSAFQD